MVLTAIRVALALFLYTIAVAVVGLALFPAALLCHSIWMDTFSQPAWQRILWVCLGAGLGYFIFGFCLMAIAGILRFLFRMNLKEGNYPLASLGMINWYITNALQFLVWSIFGDFLLMTPFAALFYRLMGAKLGLNVQINSKFCADLSLIEIGDNAVIGGHATVIAHSFETNGLVLRKVRIGKNAIVGLNAIIMPGVEIGEGAVVAAGVFVPKNTQIEAKTTYVGR